MPSSPTLDIPIRFISAHRGRSSCRRLRNGDGRMMRALATLHRWWGVAFCLLFAMWFASGIVMHFVPFPARSERRVPRELEALRGKGERIDYDQWTVAGGFDRDRPLTRIKLDDGVGTEIYLSAASGHIVLT